MSSPANGQVYTRTARSGAEDIELALDADDAALVNIVCR